MTKMTRRGRSRKQRQQRASAAQRRLSDILLSPKSYPHNLVNAAGRHLWAVTTRHNLRLPKELRHWICRGCKTPLRPGVNARVRVRRKMRCITCENCGRIRRFNLR